MCPPAVCVRSKNIGECKSKQEEDKILATPTLSKILPPPVRRIIGDLSDRERVLIGLDLLYDELTDNALGSGLIDTVDENDVTSGVDS